MIKTKFSKTKNHITTYLVIGLILIFLLLSLAACGISQQEYDSLVSKNTLLNKQISELTEQNRAISEEYNILLSENKSLNQQVSELSEQNETILQEYYNYKNDIILSEFDTAPIRAWATTSFGENSLCLLSEDNMYFQCISANTYSISESGISELWTDVLKSVQTLSYVCSKYQICCDTISIKFFDSSGLFILDVTLVIKDQTCSLNSISCNILYAAEIATVFTELATE